MIRWDLLNPGLETLIAGIAFPDQDPTFKVFWNGRPKEQTHSGTQTDILLSISDISNFGYDETRLIEVDSQEVFAQYGVRLITITIRVESFNNTDKTWAFQTIEKIRTRLRRPASIAALNVLELSIVEFGNAIPVSLPRDRREWSVAEMDVTFEHSICDAEDTSPNRITSVEVTSQIRDALGLLPTPPNWQEVITGS